MVLLLGILITHCLRRGCSFLSGKLKGVLPSFKISGGLSFDTNIMPIISLVWYNLTAQ